MKTINVEMDWTDEGCEMTVEGLVMIACPVCGAIVQGHHVCGDRAEPKPPKRKQQRKKVS